MKRLTKLKARLGRFLSGLFPTRAAKWGAIALCGILAGLVLYTAYMSRVWAYASDEPSTCVNCHVMEPYYATWQVSSHGRMTTCNDCHVPHSSVAAKYFFKAKDGLRHSYVFTVKGEPQSMKAIPESQEVIYDNCIRCHGDLTQTFTSIGTLEKEEVHDGSNFACWDCHRDMPHGGVNSLSSTPHATVPLPKSPVPSWLKAAVGGQTKALK